MSDLPEQPTLATLTIRSMHARTRHDEASRKFRNVLESGHLYPCSVKLLAAEEAWVAAVDYHTAVMQEEQARTVEITHQHAQMAAQNQQLAKSNQALRAELAKYKTLYGEFRAPTDAEKGTPALGAKRRVRK